MRALAVAVAICVVGCGGRAPPAKPDPKTLAAALDADLRELDALAHQHEGKCQPLIAALGPHVEKMRKDVAVATQAMADPDLAPRLKAEVRAYDALHPTLADRTGESLARSYLGCDKDPRLLQVIDRIPVLP